MVRGKLRKYVMDLRFAEDAAYILSDIAKCAVVFSPVGLVTLPFGIQMDAGVKEITDGNGGKGGLYYRNLPGVKEYHDLFDRTVDLLYEMGRH